MECQANRKPVITETGIESSTRNRADGEKSGLPPPLTTVELRVVLPPLVTNTWPLDRLLALCREWAAGGLASQIGERLGGVSKSAILSKVHALCKRGILAWRGDPRLARDTTPEGHRRREADRKRRERQANGDVADHREPVRTTLLPLPSISSAPPVPKRIPPLALNRPLASAPRPEPAVTHPAPKPSGRIVSCCWPIGTPGTRAFHFCEGPSLPGCPYCEPHAKKAYLSVRGHASPQAGTGAELSGAGP